MSTSDSRPVAVVVEDDVRIRRFLKATLEQHGFRYIEAENGRRGLLQAASQMPDLVILDLGLPDLDGLEVLRELRSWSAVPILVLSARGQEADKVEALDAGADDYVTKPFGVDELLARMRVALRHSARPGSGSGGGAPEPVVRFGELEVDLEKRLVFVSGREVHLTAIEYRLLATLVRHADKVLTHRQLLAEVWGPHAEFEHQYLRVFMGQLRRKLEPAPARPRWFLTETGVGYRLRTS
ncbi:MAG: response regulator [Planctomycetes bacterium]|nr:response regulator [Planctomycetota bacterium]